MGFSPKCVWISKRYACKTSQRLGMKRHPRISEATGLIGFLNSGQPIEGGADEVALLCQPDFAGHGVADLIAAHHQHSAPAQLLPGDALELPLFIRVLRLQVLPVGQYWADRDVSQLVNLPAVASEQAGRDFLRSTDAKAFSMFSFLSICSIWTPTWTSSFFSRRSWTSSWASSLNQPGSSVS